MMLCVRRFKTGTSTPPSSSFCDAVGARVYVVLMQLNPYITFPGTARAAMTRYHEILGGTLDISTFGEYGAAREGVDPNGVMHARLTSGDGLVLMGSDNGGMPLTVGDNISISLSGADDALRGYFAALAEGGTVTMALDKQVWGDEFGMVVDQFGINWMVNITASEPDHA